MPITLLYKNKVKEAVSITESEFDYGWGTAYLYDDDINSAFRGDLHYNNPGVGTSTLTFSFGSAVFMDSIAVVSNLTTTGTMWLTAGIAPDNVAESFSIPIDGLGTSHKYFGDGFVTATPQAYQYWRLWFKGATAISQHQINELFLGRRTLIQEMPSYPFENNVEENTVDLVSERGQKWVYQNYEREYFIMNFEGVNATTENNLFKMYKYCGKNTQPFWMCLDPENNPLDIKFVRFKEGAFLSSEETKNIFDITMEVEKEI